MNQAMQDFLEKYNLDAKSNICINSSNIINKQIFNNSNIYSFFSFSTLESTVIRDNINHINFIFCDDLLDFNESTFELETLKHTEYLYFNLEYYQEDINDFGLIQFPEDWILLHQYSEKEFLYKNNKYRDSLILETGAWNTKDLNEHWFDIPLAEHLEYLINNQNIKTIVDFGCGPGQYVKYFKERGFEIEGYDGNPNTPELTNNQCSVLDLTSEFELNKKFDCVLSLEVGEHIPKEYEQKYIDNLVKYSNNYIIVSWAIPEQGGYGHVNCQTNDYIKEQFRLRGFAACYNMEINLRLICEASWFKDTIMVFKKMLIQ